MSEGKEINDLNLTVMRENTEEIMPNNVKNNGCDYCIM
jgi:hypothetical protein